MCKACNVPGFAGTCAPVTAGTDSGGACPVDLPTSCGHDGTCDGAGACRYYNASVVCAPATCTTPKKSTNPKTCNGAGNCASRGSVNCQANDCDPTTGLCP
jgi:hypothetical protein